MTETPAEEWQDVSVSTLKEPRTYEAQILLKYAWVVSIERFVLLEDLEQTWTEKQFNQIYSHLPLPDDITPSKYVTEANREHRLIVDMKMSPNEGLIFTNEYGHKVLNYWKSNRTPPTEITESPDLFLKHLDYIFESKQDNIDHVLKWMAHVLFRPEIRMRHGICLSGHIQGTGKSTIAEVMKALIGEGGIQVQPNHLVKDFNSWIKGARLAVVEEVNHLGQRDLYNKVKTYFSEDVLSVEAKFKDLIKYDNYCNYLFFSNFHYPIALEPSDRRLFYVHTSVQAKPPSYYQELHDYLDLEATESTEGAMGGAWAFYKYLKDEVLPTIPEKFATTPPPKTAEKEEMAAAAEHPLINWVRDQRAEGHGPFAEKTFSKWNTLLEFIHTYFPAKHRLRHDQQVKATLREIGLHTTKPKVIDGERETIVCWFTDDKDFDSELQDLFTKTSKKDRAKLYSYYYDHKAYGSHQPSAPVRKRTFMDDLEK